MHGRAITAELSIAPFQFRGRGARKLDETVGLACRVLGISQPSVAYRRLPEGSIRFEPRTILGLTTGGKPMCLLSEAALYALIMRSDKPAAAPFQLWVTGEVLPAIRRTGGYRLAGTAPEAVEEGTVAKMPDVGGVMVRAREPAGPLKGPPMFTKGTKSVVTEVARPQALTITPIDGEARILDTVLAEHLGMSRPRDIRANLIEANREELEAYGPFAFKPRKPEDAPLMPTT
jgi:hypothetical protein